MLLVLYLAPDSHFGALLYLEKLVQFKYIDRQEARDLLEAHIPVFNRYKAADHKSPWYQGWSDWSLLEWGPEDWDFLDPNKWEDEFRVEVE